VVSDLTEDAIVQNNLLNYPYLKLQSTITYAADGNVESTEARGAKSGSVLYDYSGQLPIAEISNGKISDGVAYTSFEADGTGGWSLSPGSTIISNPNGSITGQKSFSGTLTKSVPAGKKYKLTLWSINTATATVNGLPGVALKTTGNWKLFEWNFDNISSVTVVGTNIDEVRLYPADARMMTTTYDTRFGKTSECDANNRITYYEYDTNGRPLYVKDEQRNIIKAYEYNYKN
jgi:hypothetical protein